MISAHRVHITNLGLEMGREAKTETLARLIGGGIKTSDVLIPPPINRSSVSVCIESTHESEIQILNCYVIQLDWSVSRQQ